MESLRMAYTALITNRLRSFLTILGMAIGVGAVIALVSLGRGVEDFIADEFGSLGSNLLTVSSSRPNSPTRTRIEPLTTVEASDLVNPFIAPSVARIAGDYRIRRQVSSERGGGGSFPVRGVTANYLEVRGWSLRDGQFISIDDIDATARVAVLGVDAVERLFDSADNDPTGEIIRVDGRVFTVIGVINDLDAAFSDDDETIYVPLSTAHTRLDNARTRDGGYRLSQMFVQTISEEAIESAIREIQAYLDVAHNISFQGEQDYTVANQGDLLNFFRSLTGILTVFLSLIAGISLLVAGIGVMNIMLVTVTERTREIGLRKAVGARGGDIMTQFLVESVILTLIGGVFGIGVGWVGAQMGTLIVEELNLTITTDAVLLATVVSSAVGIIFGLYPARRAARMKPIDALRFE